MAGTLRIISNKPDPGAFAGGYALELNSVSHGGMGYIAEGFFNAPISETAAIRVVAWDKKDAGYIDNEFRTRTFPGWAASSGGDGVQDNADFVEEDYNDIRTRGARAALRLNLGESWAVTPAVMTQDQEVNGNFSMDPVVGDLALSKYSPERVSDDWTQAALTVEGKIGSLDLTYAFAHLSRDVDSAFDYSEYSLWYDNYYHSLGYNSYYVNDAGEFINPAQFVNGDDRYKKRSHELRLVSPQDWRLRFLVGGFWQEQTHRILQNYQIAGLNGGPDGLSVTGWPGTLWLTNQFRTDQDEALFGEMSFDITRKLTATAGLRFFRYDNSLKGFYGFSANRSSPDR
jgi:hypothetical protein